MTFRHTAARAHQRCCLPCVCVLVKGLLAWCMPLKQGQAPGGLGSVMAKRGTYFA